MIEAGRIPGNEALGFRRSFLDYYTEGKGIFYFRTNDTVPRKIYDELIPEVQFVLVSEAVIVVACYHHLHQLGLEIFDSTGNRPLSALLDDSQFMQLRARSGTNMDQVHHYIQNTLHLKRQY